MVNRLNKIFVDTVRNTGENNKDRYLLICPYATNHLEETIEIPDGNIIVSIHMYPPYTFCQDEGAITTWNMEDEECAGCAEEVRRYFADMERLFVKKEFRLYGGIMEVIMGSWIEKSMNGHFRRLRIC